MSNIIPNCYNPQVQDAFNLMVDTLQSEGLKVVGRDGKDVAISDLALKVLNTAARRSGGAFTEDQIKTVIEMQQFGSRLTGNRIAKYFCNKSVHGPLKKRVLYDPNYSGDKTYRYALNYYTLGRDPSRLQEYQATFDENILYVTNGTTGGVTEGREATLKDLARKYKMIPDISYDIFPLILTHGNMAVTFVNNKFPSGNDTNIRNNFVLASLTLHNTEAGPNEGKTLVQIDMADLATQALALGSDFLHKPSDFLQVVKQLVGHK